MNVSSSSSESKCVTLARHHMFDAPGDLPVTDVRVGAEVHDKRPVY